MYVEAREEEFGGMIQSIADIKKQWIAKQVAEKLRAANEEGETCP